MMQNTLNTKASVTGSQPQLSTVLAHPRSDFARKKWLGSFQLIMIERGVVYYGTFVTPMGTPLRRMSKHEDEKDVVLDESDVVVASDAVAIDEVEKELFVVYASIRSEDMFWEKRKRKGTGELKSLPILQKAIRDGRVSLLCSSVRLFIQTATDDETTLLKYELGKPDMEIVGPSLFASHATTPMQLALRQARFWTLVTEPVNRFVNDENRLCVLSWQVFGPRKDKYGLVAKSISSCFRRIAENAWGVSEELVKSSRCLYVGDEFCLRNVELTKWPPRLRPKKEDFPENWIFDEMEAMPPFVCFVLFCPLLLKERAEVLVGKLLDKFRVPLKSEQSPVTDLDLSSSSNFKYLDEAKLDSAIERLDLSECGIDAANQKMASKVCDMVRKLPHLRFLNLSYNRLSGEPAIKFLSDLRSIRSDARIDITGNVLASQKYDLPKYVMK
jgi:hypothetical protein